MLKRKKKRDDSDTQYARQFYFQLIYGFFLMTWTLILWTILLYKVWSDWIEFFHFFTNWNWTLQTAFFTLELCAYFADAKSMRIFNLSFFFWIVNGTTWLVFWLVMFMIKDNAEFFLKLSTLEGGKYDFSVVLNGHALFHVLISISILVYVVLQKEHIEDSVSIFIDWRHEGDEYDERSKKSLHNNWQVSTVLFLFYVLVGPLLILALYVSIFDIRATYGITTPWWILVLSSIGVVLVFGGIYAYGALLYLTKPRTRLYRYERFWRSCCYA